MTFNDPEAFLKHIWKIVFEGNLPKSGAPWTYDDSGSCLVGYPFSNGTIIRLKYVKEPPNMGVTVHVAHALSASLFEFSSAEDLEGAESALRDACGGNLNLKFGIEDAVKRDLTFPDVPTTLLLDKTQYTWRGFTEGLTLRDIADILGMPEDTKFGPRHIEINPYFHLTFAGYKGDARLKSCKLIFKDRAYSSTWSWIEPHQKEAVRLFKRYERIFKSEEEE